VRLDIEPSLATICGSATAQRRGTNKQTSCGRPGDRALNNQTKRAVARASSRRMMLNETETKNIFEKVWNKRANSLRLTNEFVNMHGA